MIKKDAIRKTAVSYWSAEDNAFIVASPLFNNIAGVGETRDEAISVFEDMLDASYEYLKNDNAVGYKRGRPAKGGVDLHCQLQPDARDEITKLGKALGGLSQGETVEYLLHYFQCKSRERYSNHPPNHEQDVESRLENVEWIMTRAIENGLVKETESAYRPKSKSSSNSARLEMPPNVSAAEFLAALVAVKKRKLPDVSK